MTGDANLSPMQLPRLPFVKPAREMPPALKPPQFSLRTLLLLVTAFAVLFALVNVLPPMILAGLVFLLLSIFAHVAGNVIGTRLRDIGGRPGERRLNGPDEALSIGGAGTPRCAPPTELSRRQSLGWPILVVTSAGAICGAIGGGFWTAWLTGNHITALALSIGSIACCVLGGFAAFLAFSFAQVGLGALRQAMAGAAPSSAEDARG
jgi:hypothetical protein